MSHSVLPGSGSGGIYSGGDDRGDRPEPASAPTGRHGSSGPRGHYRYVHSEIVCNLIILSVLWPSAAKCFHVCALIVLFVFSIFVLHVVDLCCVRVGPFTWV